MYLLRARVELKALHHDWGLCQFFLRVWSNYIIQKMNFAAALSLFTNLVLKHLGSIFGCHNELIDTNIRHCEFQQPAYYHFSYFLKLYNTHTGKALAGISPTGMELIFSEYIRL